MSENKEIHDRIMVKNELTVRIPFYVYERNDAQYCVKSELCFIE